MFERIKRMTKKEKGFTLVELLAVIAILGIIVAIAVPTIGNVIEDSEEKAHIANVNLIENAAKLAAVSEGETDVTYTLGDLRDKGFLNEIPADVAGNNYSASHNVVVNGSNAVYNKYADVE